MVQRVTDKAWFGPKQTVGWGWRPQSWEGWLTTVAFIAVLTAALELLTGAGRIVGAVLVLAVFCAVVLFTGDPPGGPQ